MTAYRMQTRIDGENARTWTMFAPGGYDPLKMAERILECSCARDGEAVAWVDAVEPESEFEAALWRFAERVQAGERERLVSQFGAYNARGGMPTLDLHFAAWFVTLPEPGRKYQNVDVGTSGRYMVDRETGRIYGIKGYGRVHKGRVYGAIAEPAIR